jgi:hypothetical protein
MKRALFKEGNKTNTQSKDKTRQKLVSCRQQQEFNKCNGADHYAARKVYNTFILSSINTSII